MPMVKTNLPERHGRYGRGCVFSMSKPVLGFKQVVSSGSGVDALGVDGAVVLWLL